MNKEKRIKNNINVLVAQIMNFAVPFAREMLEQGKQTEVDVIFQDKTVCLTPLVKSLATSDGYDEDLYTLYGAFNGVLDEDTSIANIVIRSKGGDNLRVTVNFNIQEVLTSDPEENDRILKALYDKETRISDVVILSVSDDTTLLHSKNDSIEMNVLGVDSVGLFNELKGTLKEAVEKDNLKQNFDRGLDKIKEGTDAIKDHFGITDEKTEKFIKGITDKISEIKIGEKSPLYDVFKTEKDADKSPFAESDRPTTTHHTHSHECPWGTGEPVWDNSKVRPLPFQDRMTPDRIRKPISEEDCKNLAMQIVDFGLKHHKEPRNLFVDGSHEKSKPRNRKRKSNNTIANNNCEKRTVPVEVKINECIVKDYEYKMKFLELVEVAINQLTESWEVLTVEVTGEIDEEVITLSLFVYGDDTVKTVRDNFEAFKRDLLFLDTIEEVNIV